MLENIRKYTGLMFVVLILLFVGLIFLESSSNSRGYGSGPVVLEIDGRGYTQQEFQRLGATPLRVLEDLSRQSQMAQFAVMPFTYQMGTRPDSGMSGDIDPLQFLSNRLILQRSAREFGIHPSVPEVEAFLRERIFVNQDGTFNAEAYDKYVNDSLPSRGMSIKDLNELVGELLTLGKLTDILSAGVEPTRDAVREEIADSQQEVSYKLATFPASAYEDETPAEEEVKVHWEENRGRYLSDAKVRLTYVLATPDFESKLAEKRAAKAEEDAADPAGETTPPAEDPSKDPDDLAAEAADGEEAVTLTTEERDELIREAGGLIDRLYEALLNSEGEGFEEEAATLGLEVQMTELFTRDECPEQLKQIVFGVGRQAVDVVLQDDPGNRPLDALSEPVPARRRPVAALPDRRESRAGRA